MTIRQYGVVGLLLMVSACAQPKPYYTIKTTYDPAVTVWAQQKGTATIRGQAFLKTRGGDVKLCAGNEVGLIPDSPYVEEIAAAMRSGQFSGPANKDPAYVASVRRTLCDAQGNFSFHDLPAGEWIVQAVVRWQVPIGASMLRQGGVLIKRATTKPGETTDIIVTE